MTAIVDDTGDYERVYDALSVSAKVSVGRRIARMLDVGEIPQGQARTAIRVMLKAEYDRDKKERKRKK